MTVEADTDLLQRAFTQWTPNSPRNGEHRGRVVEAEPASQTDEELVFPTLSPPPIAWPRIFPGL
ncbi:MAG TPA: hypothetical protein VG651_00970 [Stellaceae bacterium]|nr:hypothetical protein [Stellaceae bacterium]